MNLRDDNYVSIHGWMINKLKLKGNDLIVYAIIHNFSQAENQVFNGSLQYLASWTNSTKQGVQKNIKNLLEKGYIIKRYKIVNNLKQCYYIAVNPQEVCNSVVQGMQLSCIGGMQLSCTNNKDINNKEDNIYGKKKNFTPPTVEEIAEYCVQRKNKVNPKKFYDFYESSNWVDSKGNKVKNWKQKVITWEKDEQSIEVKPVHIPSWVGKEVVEQIASQEEIKALEELLDNGGLRNRKTN